MENLFDSVYSNLTEGANIDIIKIKYSKETKEAYKSYKK